MGNAHVRGVRLLRMATVGRSRIDSPSIRRPSAGGTLALALLFLLAGWSAALATTAGPGEVTLRAGSGPAWSGAVDADGDGHNDTVDDCPHAAGTSTVDRLGCPDRDSDGTSDWTDRSSVHVAGWNLTNSTSMADGVRWMDHDPASERLLIVDDAKHVEVWNTSTRTLINRTTINGTTWLSHAAIAPGGDWGIVVDFYDNVYRFDLPSMNLVWNISLDGSGFETVYQSAIHPNGSVVAVSVAGDAGVGGIHMLDPSNGSEIELLDPSTAAPRDYHGLAWSPDGTLLAAGGPGLLTVMAHDGNGTLVANVSVHSNGTWIPDLDDLAWSADGRWIGACSPFGGEGPRSYGINATSWQLEWMTPKHSTTCESVDISSDGRLMASALTFTGVDANHIVIHDMVTGTAIDRMTPAPSGQAISALWLPGDLELVSAHAYQNEQLAWWTFPLDVDGDHWNVTDLGDGKVDAFPTDPTQWNDTDGDGYGDNWGDGALNASRAGGPGRWVPLANGTDGCPTVTGTSWLDRYGCPDRDADGVSDPDANWTTSDGADAFPLDPLQTADRDLDGHGDRWYPNGTTDGLHLDQWGDAFPDEPTQWNDTDGDGYGDNHADANQTVRWTTNQWPGQHVPGAVLTDAFPILAAQWNDTDGDGWGDRTLDTRGDHCIHAPGGSLNDRNGCPDADGDGWSDPDANESASPLGTADAFPADPTQWADSDGDGFGDNHSGTDGDDCSGLPGNSSVDRVGCPDEDGDGWSDIEDAFDDIPSQWLDSDGDGYGDNWDNASWNASRNGSWPGIFLPGAYLPDRFPLDPTQTGDRDADGYGDNPNGHFGDRWPDDPLRWSDRDGDGYADQPDGVDADMCPDRRGTSTDAATRGCPDSDGDGHVDDDDEFPLNPYQWVDTDQDGLGDNPTGADGDQCPEVWGNATNGTSDGCIDTDGDGWADREDAFPSDPVQWVDTDGDGHGDVYGWTNETVVDPDVPGGELVLRVEFGDAFPDDWTQWSDRDGDGHGDNVSGTAADLFPLRVSQWRDSDGDGYGDSILIDSWQPDACRLEAGTSTEDRLGCPDRDGDGWSDLGDGCPDDAANHTVPDLGCAVVVDDATGGVEGGEEGMSGSTRIIIGLGVLIVLLLSALLVGQMARTMATRKARDERERAAAESVVFEDLETGQRRAEWIGHYVAAGDLDKARDLGWDGVNPPAPVGGGVATDAAAAATGPGWQELAARDGLGDGVTELPSMPEFE